MHLGIDIGTSGVKVVIVDDSDTLMASASRSYQVSRPHPLWSEQHPDLWWNALGSCMDSLRSEHPEMLSKIRGIGLSGQMLGSVLIDADNRPVRNAILWNDGRSVKEAGQIIKAIPGVAHRVGCRPNPGFVAPKILWLAAHEPAILDKTDCILLPKDYIFLKLTGKRITEPTDACGTHFMEARTAQWAQDLMEHVGVKPKWLPDIVPSYEAGGKLLSQLADKWGIQKHTVVAVGAGDNMAGAIGVGVGNPGDGVLSIGTSAVNCIVDGSYRPIPDKAVITHPHVIPETYLSMSVVLSATSCLDWAAGLMGMKAHELATRTADLIIDKHLLHAPVFLPYVNGIRTPHDMPEARGVMTGLDLRTDSQVLGWAVLEGIAFHIVEGILTQRNKGIEIEYLQFIGGGSRSRLWGEMIASMIDIPLHLPVGREVGASMGAARLAMVASGSRTVSDLCIKPPSEDVIEPNDRLKLILEQRFGAFQEIFSCMKSNI